MKKIIVDGANGYVASYFIKCLLENNYSVTALVRSSKSASSHERINDALKKVGCNSDERHLNLTVVDYSLLDTGLGILDTKLHEIFECDVDYWHFAASLKFRASDIDEIFQTNIDGARNTIELFLQNASKNSRYFLISTAYSCGKISNPVGEVFFDDEDISRFRNCYEQSKRHGENILKHYLNNNELKGYVIRLGQVVGENKSGICKTDYGIFDFIKRICSFCRQYPNKTVRIRSNPESSQNLVPVDFVADCLLKIVSMKINSIPAIINLVNKKQMMNSDIVDIINNLLPINIILVKDLDASEMTIYEKIISAGMAFTGGYTSLDIEFNTSSLDNIIKADHDIITKESLSKMIKYFINGRVRN